MERKGGLRNIREGTPGAWHLFVLPLGGHIIHAHSSKWAGTEADGAGKQSGTGRTKEDEQGHLLRTVHAESREPKVARLPGPPRPQPSMTHGDQGWEGTLPKATWGSQQLQGRCPRATAPHLTRFTQANLGGCLHQLFPLLWKSPWEESLSREVGPAMEHVLNGKTPAMRSILLAINLSRILKGPREY